MCSYALKAVPTAWQMICFPGKSVVNAVTAVTVTHPVICTMQLNTACSTWDSRGEFFVANHIIMLPWLRMLSSLHFNAPVACLWMLNAQLRTALHLCMCKKNWKPLFRLQASGFRLQASGFRDGLSLHLHSLRTAPTAFIFNKFFYNACIVDCTDHWHSLQLNLQHGFINTQTWTSWLMAPGFYHTEEAQTKKTKKKHNT